MTDEYEGQGGSYTLDPKTGKRTLIERTDDPLLPSPRPPAQAPIVEPAPASRKAKDEI